MIGLDGKNVIVTGGANGIGRACVEAFVEHGTTVTFSDIESYDGAALSDELGDRVYFVQGDMGEQAMCCRLAEAAAERFGGVDFLVNNAFSFISEGPDAEREDWRRMMEVGPFAFATMCQAVRPLMKQRGGGAIVQISSISAHIAQPGRWTYNVAKAGVNQLTRCVALDFATDGIRVNTVSPGWIWTREVEKAANFDRQKWGPIWGNFQMLRRLGDPREVAHAVLFLCSDYASFITGAELPVDGGYLGLGSEGLGENSEFAGTD